MQQESNQILIDSYRVGKIDKIARDNATIFASFSDFVDEAIGTYITFWTDPAQAEVNFQNLLPHLKPKQLEFMKKMMNEADPTGQEYENFTKNMNAARSNLEPLDYFPLKNPGQQRFHLDDFRFSVIEKIIQTENVSKKLKSVKEFVDYAITLFMTWWTEPETAMPLQYAIWPYMPTQVKEEWKNNPNFAKTFIQFDRNAKEWNEKQGHDLTELENDALNRKNINSEIRGKTKFESFAAPDERQSMKTVTNEGAKDLRRICSDIEETKRLIKKFSVPKHRTDDALPYDDFPLIWEFYSRILPMKLLVAVLADMMVKKGTPLVSYKEFREKGYYAALGLSDSLSDYEKKYGIKRNEKRSTGFPISPIHILAKKEIEKEKKFAASKERFQEHFIGMKKEAWVKRQYENDPEEKNRKQRKGLAYFDGALNAMGLIHVHAELYGNLKPEWQEKEKKFVYPETTVDIATGKDTWKNPASKYWELKIGLTQKGVDFFLLENPILRDFPEWSESNIFSKEESNFIIKNIMPDFPLENELIKKSIDTISKSSKNSVSGKDIDDKFNTIILQWLQENEDHFSFNEINKFRDKTLRKIDGKPKGMELAKAWRARTMARLVELNQIEWNMEPKTGKPLYSMKKEADLISQ